VTADAQSPQFASDNNAGICPEALARDISELKQVNMVIEAVEDLIFGYVDCVV